ncbi:methionyl-tRNA formyltransferase [Erythrobacter crassostreae]|uniref:Methionyl-tRNA formyltransferase n=1 Tax=Erythrobacter crassostreae TaxID=2828328 RepID=A0A9X1JKT0_9SPHN|nr:methionyl-tRNA formyltransferase [Erythrobacter crassostrea]MBV7259405.1 methionyl-tRNA formyltransferase [Erythrobacter crassostrea]
MKIAFMGTPDFAVPALAALHDAGHEIVCVYTQPPRPAGRGKKLRPSPVQAKAEALGLEVRSPKSLRNEAAQADFAALNADVAVVAAYGLILPQAVLDAPTHGCLNIHASILPRWRGAAPIHRAIMAGDEETGVTIMQMEAGLDTGPMLHIIRTPIADKTTGELTAELAELGAGAMVEVLADLDRYDAQPQDDGDTTYAPKIDKAEARIDWSLHASDLVRHVQGLAPFPGAWFELEGERIKLLSAEEVNQAGDAGAILDDTLTVACGKGAIRPLRLQRAGKPAMSTGEFLRGRTVPQGTQLD